MGLPVFVCFVPLVEEMAYINERLSARTPPAIYRSGKFDKKRVSHSYEIRTGKPGQAFMVKFIRMGSMGNIGTAAVVASVLQQERPDAAFIVGIAGSMDLKQLALGDVVLAASAGFIGPDKVQALRTDEEAFGGAPSPGATSERKAIDVRKRLGESSWRRFRRDFIEFDNGAREKVNAFLQDRKAGDEPVLSSVEAVIDVETPDGISSTEHSNPFPKIVDGCILGSEWVVDSEEFLGFLIERTAGDEEDWYTKHGGAEGRDRNVWIDDFTNALDMETYGFFRALKALAARNVSIPHAFAIRGISDPCKDKHSLQAATREGVRRTAAHNSVDTMISFIEYYRLFDAGVS